jgi:hypothetical protein
LTGGRLVKASKSALFVFEMNASTKIATIMHRNDKNLLILGMSVLKNNHFVLKS